MPGGGRAWSRDRISSATNELLFVLCGRFGWTLPLEFAALLACGKGSFISHRSAAFVWGMWKTPPREVEVSVVRRCCASRDGIRVHRIQGIDPQEAVRRFTPRELKLVLARHRGRRGAGHLAELIADDTAMTISRSRAETALLRLIRDARLPMPETNVRFGRYEADFVWREQRVIVELDSATYHSGPGVFRRDRDKAWCSERGL
jgi:hypothetical protein